MKKGFTLIELLVVVLIIGILAAVALPQYEKAVWKSRSANMLSALRSLANAQDAFYLSNGFYSNEFASLDISFDSLPEKPTTKRVFAITSTDAMRANENWELIVAADPPLYSSLVSFKKGPYANCGFTIPHTHHKYNSVLTNGELYCFETSGQKDKFCKPFFNASYLTSYQGLYYYKYQ